MIIPDTNLLIYAYDLNSRFHPQAKEWLQNIFRNEEEIGFLPVVIYGFVRITTAVRVFQSPLSITEAEQIVRAWLEEPNARVLESGIKEVEKAIDLLGCIGAAGNLVTDAQIAAAAILREAVVHTCDSHFLRFPEVRWLNPISRTGSTGWK